MIFLNHIVMVRLIMVRLFVFLILIFNVGYGYAQTPDLILNCSKENNEAVINDKLILDDVKLHLTSGKCIFKQAIIIGSNVLIIGAGEGKSIIEDGRESSNPDSLITNQKFNETNNLTIQDLSLQGNVATLGFSEHVHLIELFGASNVDINHVKLSGFRGDGIYLGFHGKHNKNISISSAAFDGITKNNRNEISIIDGDNIRITKSQFDNTTRRDMPGAIDIEPNRNKEHVVKNITISHNEFSNIGGKAAIVVSIKSKLKSILSNVFIYGNKIQNTNRGIFIRSQAFDIRALTGWHYDIHDNSIMDYKITKVYICNISGLSDGYAVGAFNSDNLCWLDFMRK